MARALGAGSCERTYAKYRVGESLRVVHRTDAGAFVAGRSFPDAAAAYERALKARLRWDRGPASPTHRSWTPCSGRSPTTAGSRRSRCSPARAESLDRLLGQRCAGARLVAYAAERSATAACLDAHGRIIGFAKVHAGEGAARERRATQSVRAALDAGDAGLRVPHLLGGDGATLALEPLPGRRLDVLPAGARVHALERLGAALATLHGLRPPDGVRFSRFTPDRLARAVGAIATAQPAAGRAAAELLAALLGRHADATAPAVCVHGDANLRNALLDGDRVSLIDLEDVAAGPAAADVGHVLAALLCARVSGALPVAAEHALARSLLQGYATVAAPPRPEALTWHTAAAVLARRALTAVNRVREADLRHLDAFLHAARALLR